jgi:capsular exopolysaccharide synthesis family protein
LLDRRATDDRVQEVSVELTRIARILRKRWILVVSFLLIGLLGGALAAILTPVEYKSTTRLFVAVQIAAGSSSGDLVQGNNFAAQKVMSYLDVATSPRVLNPVIESLGLDVTAKELAEDVTATVEPTSVIMELAALSDTAESATELSGAVAASFADVVVNQIEAPADGSASPVKVEVLQPAVPSEYPEFPQVPLNLALGGALGLMAGLVVAVSLGLTDRRIHGRSDIERVTDVPVLGSITLDPQAQKRPLVVAQEPRSIRAEAYRTLRTNLEFVGVNDRARTVVITSALTGEGKTITLANLAIALTDSGSTVALIDADLRMPRLAEMMGLDGTVGLTDVLIGRAQLADVIQPWGRTNRLVVLPAGRIPPNPSELLGSKPMAQLLESLAAEFDYVLIDAPPVLPVTDAAVLGRLTAGTLLVAAANIVKEQELQAAVRALVTAGITPLGIVATMLPTRGPDAQVYGSYGDLPMKEDEVAAADAEPVVPPAATAPAPALVGSATSRLDADRSATVRPRL